MTLNTPLQIAAQWHAQRTGPGGSFSGLINWFMHHGLVYSDSSVFLLARPWQIDVGIFEEAPRPDTWFLYLAATNGVTPLSRFMDIAPFELPQVAFYRRERCLIYEWETLARKLKPSRKLTYGRPNN